MEKIEIIKKETNELLTKLGVDFELKIEEDNGCFKIQINSEQDAPLLIGKHGDMISSFQKILEAILFNILKEDVTLLININDYREKQKERLEKIADNVCKRVIEEQRQAFLKSFSAYERRVIHEYIANNFPELESQSEGEGIDRKLIINFKKS